MTSEKKAKPEFHLPDDFKHPEPPKEMVESLHDAISELIHEYLPPEWVAAIETYAITFAYELGDAESMADFQNWTDDLAKLQMFVAGVRYDQTGHWSEWMGPVSYTHLTLPTSDLV